MPKVTDVYKRNDGHVRTVKLRVGNNTFNENPAQNIRLSDSQGTVVAQKR